LTARISPLRVADHPATSLVLAKSAGRYLEYAVIALYPDRAGHDVHLGDAEEAVVILQARPLGGRPCFASR